MELYRYKAVDGHGRMMRGRFDAINVDDLEARLTRLGLDLVSYKEVKATRVRIMRAGVKRSDLITFCFHLEQLLRAGVPILEGLADLRDSIENMRLRQVTSAMIESIGGGKNLSQAMAEFPQVFDTVFVSLVKAGENSGQLNQVLRHITDNLKWQDEQAAHTRKLMMYPSFVMVVVIAIVFFLMIYLVPQLLSVVQMMGQELPLHTKVLVALSKFFMEFWYVILSVPILAYASIRLGVETNPNFRHKVDSFKLKVPILGLILKKLILARFANYFAIMYASGITVLECARVCESIVGNKAVEDAVRTAGREIADGSRISTAFESTSLFPPLVLRMLRVGENTGALEEALLNVSYFYNRDVKESVERLQTVIEPVMTVTVGLLLAWIMVSILGPVYELISQIKI